MVARCVWRRPKERGSTFRCRFDECEGGGEVWDRYGEHVRILGLGRRTLLNGFGDRACDHDCHWTRQLPADARWLSPDGRTFSHGAIRSQSARAHGATIDLV